MRQTKKSFRTLHAKVTDGISQQFTTFHLPPLVSHLQFELPTPFADLAGQL
jgi:hypothetical protein